MIDTDKYEGHNMHPALLDVGDDYNNWDALQEMGFNDEARQLIADAPLLLEEVKRLRELKIAEEDELERLCNHAEFYEGEYNLARRTNQERLTEIKRLREGIKEQMQFALNCVGSDIGDLYETIADDLRRLIE